MSDTTAVDRMFDPLAWVVLALLSICFGSSFLFQEIALTDISPAGVAAARLIIASVVLVVMARALGHGLPTSGRIWAWAALNGALGFGLPIYLTVWAQQYVPTGLIGVIYAGIPLIMLALSRIVLNVVITWRKGLGLGIGSIGLVVLAGPDLSGGDLWAHIGPKLAVLASAVMLASAGITVRLMPKGSVLSGVAAASLCVAVVSLPVAWASWPADTPGYPALLALLGVGLVSTGLGQFFRFFLIRRKGPVFIAPNGYLAAIVTVVLGVLVLDEAVTPILTIGFTVILLGLFVSQDGSGRMARL